MTNMKDRLRPHRKTKVNFQTKSRNITAITKEQLIKSLNEEVDSSSDIIILKQNNGKLKRNIKETVAISKDKFVVSSNIVILKKSARGMNRNVRRKDTAIPESDQKKNDKKTIIPKRNTKGLHKNNNIVAGTAPSKKNGRVRTVVSSSIVILKPNIKRLNKNVKISDSASKEDLVNTDELKTGIENEIRLAKHNDKDKENSSPRNNKKKIEKIPDTEVPQEKVKRTYTKRKILDCDGAGPPAKSKKMNTSGSSSNKSIDSSDSGPQSKYEKKSNIKSSISNGIIRENFIKAFSVNKKQHECSDCGKIFRGKNDLKKHYLIHIGLRPFVCEHCKKQFRQAGHLRNHISSIHSDIVEHPTVYSCDYCSKTFLIKERLPPHLRTHTGHKPYSCKLCNMRFARTGQLRQHELKHTGEHKFVCEHCLASFTCSAKLKHHINSHLSIRNYTCYLCGKSFGRPDAIKKHMTCFHNNEKPFQCPVCKKYLKGHLQEHMRTHKSEKPHGCAECGKRFAQRSQLTVHQRKHSGARPYRCRVCWKAFSHSTALTLHTRRHTGEKPFTCRICSQRFAQQPHMKKHMLFVHGDSKSYIHAVCGSTFHTKIEYDSHKLCCECKDEHFGEETSEEILSKQISEAFCNPVEPPMKLTKMRLLLAVLLKKISGGKRLRKLGFNKRLIDDILIDSLESSGHDPSTDMTISDAERLKINVQKFLEWTVPPQFMKKFRSENKSTEELLEELTS